MDFGRVITFIVTLIAGIAIMKNTVPIVRMIGRSGWAERNLGAGGTYTMWTLIGIGIILIGFLYLMGVLDFNPQEAEDRALQGGTIQPIQ